MRTLTVAFLGAALSACATTSGVVKIGPDTYMVERHATAGWTSDSGLKLDAIKDANAFCGSQKKETLVSGTSDQGATFGNGARAEIQFMCLEQGDPQLKRPMLTPVSAK